MFDPVVQSKFYINREEKIATAGSCFAQHISRALCNVGFNYYIADLDENMSAEESHRNNYGVFSARYGNIYTVKQLLQLFDESFDEIDKHEKTWERSDGKIVDPYRPLIQPDGFDSNNDVIMERKQHLQDVRRMFSETGVFIFTLGLTEGWRSKLDGSVFPMAPGVSGGTYNTDIHEFVNFDIYEIESDLNTFMKKFREVNNKVRVILTVSPVPLIATYEHRHVLVSNTYSKSVLRVVATMVSDKYDWVDYFPSFEIITGNYNNGSYYGKDFRSVTPSGVAHAMRIFLKHYIEDTDIAITGDNNRKTVYSDDEDDIVCDEEQIEAVRVKS